MLLHASDDQTAICGDLTVRSAEEMKVVSQSFHSSVSLQDGHLNLQSGMYIRATRNAFVSIHMHNQL